jgi:tRNA (guanine-N(7)-)-methyltransferase
MRKILSFARRVGRSLSGEQKNLLSEFLPTLNNKNIVTTTTEESSKFLFESTKFKECVLEVGFGNGIHLFQRIITNPEKLYVGCEPYLNGVVSFLTRIKSSEKEIDNVFIWSDDVNILLDKVNDNIFDKIYILFPDPWPKKKQQKRRIINKGFLEILSKKLKKHGAIIIATDHDEYAEHILSEIKSCKLFDVVSNTIKDYMNFPEDWVNTKYQDKAKKIDKSSYYFEFNCITNTL